MAVYLCPVCKGKGLVNANFYNVCNEGIDNLSDPITCRTCAGKGVLWDKDKPKEEPKNTVGDPKSKEVNWDKVKSNRLIDDGFLGKVGV